MILQIFNCLSCFSLPLTAMTFLFVLYPSSTLFACFSLMLSMCPHFFVIGIWFSCEHGSTFRRTGRLENSRWLRSRTSKSFLFNTLTSNSWTFSIIFFLFLCFFIFCHFWSLIMIISCLCIKQKIWLLTFGFFCRHQIHYFTHSRSPYLFYPIYRPSFFFLPTPLRFPLSLSLSLSLHIPLSFTPLYTSHSLTHTNSSFLLSLFSHPPGYTGNRASRKIFGYTHVEGFIEILGWGSGESSWINLKCCVALITYYQMLLHSIPWNSAPLLFLY